MLAQSGVQIPGAPSTDPNQPVLHTPFSAKSHFLSINTKADGTVIRVESWGSTARDSQGRTYKAGKRSWTYFDGRKEVQKAETLYRIEDPLANTETRWETTSRKVKVIHWPGKSPNDEKLSGAWPQGCLQPLLTPGNDQVTKLGERTIQGLLAEGTRTSYVVPAGRDHNEYSITVSHETWYCPSLKIVILEINDDPRSGTTRDELVDITRGEPDVAQFRPPAGYVVQEVQIP